MWGYDKKLQYPVNIKNPNPQMAKFIISQYGGPDGELSASLRYLSQRFSMPTEITQATLNDIRNCGISTNKLSVLCICCYFCILGYSTSSNSYGLSVNFKAFFVFR